MSWLLFVVLAGYSQNKFLLPDDLDKDKIRFKLVNNLVIVPVEINGTELSFLLDSGVRKPIIFSLFKETDSLVLKNTEIVYIKGLGEGEPVEALKSENNSIKIGNAFGGNQTVYALFNEKLNFSPRLGLPVHGILGYDLFKDFVVEINYSSQYIKLHKPETYQYKTCRKCRTFDLEFHNNKPYFNVDVGIAGTKIPIKLLIDSGGTDALWLFEDEENGLTINNKYFEDFLGHGLNGSVYGKRSRVDKLYIDDFELNQVNVAFPDSTSITHAKNIEDRNGSFSGGLLKRFNLIIDYPNNKITLRKNKFFDEPFSYNKAGIELEKKGIRLVKERQNNLKIEDVKSIEITKDGIRFVTDAYYKYSLKPAFTVVEVRKGSPADRIGLLKGDVIISINKKDTKNLSLQEVSGYFYDEENKKIRLNIERRGVPFTFVFRLEDPLK